MSVTIKRGVTPSGTAIEICSENRAETSWAGVPPASVSEAYATEGIKVVILVQGKAHELEIPAEEIDKLPSLVSMLAVEVVSEYKWGAVCD